MLKAVREAAAPNKGFDCRYGDRVGDQRRCG